MSKSNIADEIERYLRTGDADMDGCAWPGDFMERGRRQHADLRGALVEEVRRLAKGRSHEPVPANVGVEFTRAKVEPMVRGLFSKAEQDVVLATFEKSVVYVTTDTIEPILLNHMSDRSAWDLANLYLLSVGAKLLGKKAPRIVGLSEETTCYVSPDYFAEDDPFADFIVHEAAHIFHNCKRRTIGLRETRRKEWLLEIEFGQRETFAYSLSTSLSVRTASTEYLCRHAMWPSACAMKVLPTPTGPTTVTCRCVSTNRIETSSSRSRSSLARSPTFALAGPLIVPGKPEMRRDGHLRAGAFARPGAFPYDVG